MGTRAPADPPGKPAAPLRRPAAASPAAPPPLAAKRPAPKAAFVEEEDIVASSGVAALSSPAPATTAPATSTQGGASAPQTTTQGQPSSEDPKAPEGAAAPRPLAKDNEPKLSFDAADEPELAVEAQDDKADEPKLSFDAADEPELAVEADEPELSVEAEDDEPELAVEAEDNEPELSFEAEEAEDDEPELSFDADEDDEPELSFDADEDDEPELTFDADEADEPELSFDADEDDERELAETDELSSETQADHGAVAARRTVSYRKPRKENYAFIGSGRETLRRRLTLLETLSERREGAQKTSLLLSAAELAEQLGAADEASAFYARAREATPNDVMVIRALRRQAVSRSDWTEVASLLEEETQLPLAEVDLAAALLLLAEVQHHHLGDRDAAILSLRQAAALPDNEHRAVCLLLLGNMLAQDTAPDTEETQLRAANAWHDPQAKSVLQRRAALRAEREGRPAASIEEPDGLFALIAARSAKNPEQIAGAFAQLSGELHSPLLKEAFARSAAVFAPALDVAGSPEPKRSATLLHRARTTEGAPRRAALEAFVDATPGAARSAALVELAEALGAVQAWEEADTALRNAALADESLALVPVIREILARRAGDTGRLARVVETEDAAGGHIEAAAKLVAANANLDDEAQRVAAAAEAGEHPLCADMLRLDIAAEQGHRDDVNAALRRIAEHQDGPRRLSALLALSRRLPEGEADAVLQQLLEAASPDEGSVARRNLARKSTASVHWRDEADATLGSRAALALMLCAGDTPSEADLDEMLSIDPNFAPARWALEAQAADPVAFWHQQREMLPGALSKLATLRLLKDAGESDPELAREALEAAPEDEVLRAIAEHFAGREQRAELLATDTSEAPRSRQLRRALALLAKDAPSEASATLRNLEATDTFALWLREQAELAAGDFARLADRRFAAVKEAEASGDEGKKAAALEALASLDLHERDDASAAILTYQSLRQVAPGHLPTLRLLERYYMDQGRDEALAQIETALAKHHPATEDAGAHARLAATLLRGASIADELIVDATRRTLENNKPLDRWLVRRAKDLVDEPQKLALLKAFAEGLEDHPGERAAVLLEAADLAEGLGDAEAATALLEPAAEALPKHPIVHRKRSELLASAAPRQRADAAEKAAGASLVDAHQGAFWYDAGLAWEESGDSAAALEAYQQSAAIDLRRGDLFERMRSLLVAADAPQKLAALTQRRIEAGDDDAQVMLGLQEAFAQLQESLGNRDGARQALRDALAIDPQHIDALRRLAELALEAEDWREATETLIRIARIRQDRDELRWVFFTLGDIYDQHMPDPRRAEAAFRRVLKLVPGDLETHERLASLYAKNNAWPQAIAELTQLTRLERDPDLRRDYGLRLSGAHEAAGDLRSAEQVLDAARRLDPTDLIVLRAMADLYERQNAHAALGMHLGRSITDFRARLEAEYQDETLWVGLVELLHWRKQHDATRLAANAARALGFEHPEFEAGLQPPAGAGVGAFDPQLHERLAAPPLLPVVFEVFRLGHETFEKVLPFESRAWKVSKASRAPQQNLLRELCRNVGLPERQLSLSDAAPNACLVTGKELVVGRRLLENATDGELRFLFLRALKIGQLHLEVTERAEPEALALAIAALVRHYDPNFEAPGFDPKELAAMTKKVGRAIPRRVRDALGPVVVEMAAWPGFDARHLGAAVTAFGNRAALLTTGSVGDALGALSKQVGRPLSPELVSQKPSLNALLQFAISDLHFDLRRQLGADRR